MGQSTLPIHIPHGFASSRSSTLGSFSRMKKPGAKGEGVSSGPLVILTPPSSNNSGPSSTPSNLPQNGATDNMDPQPIQPFNNEPQLPDTSPSSPLIGDSGVCISLVFTVRSKPRIMPLLLDASLIHIFQDQSH